MKNSFSVLFALLISGFAFPTAFAADTASAPTTWEFDGSSAAGLKITSSSGVDSATTVTAALGAGYFITPHFEANLAAAYSHVSDDGGHVLAFVVGPTFNFCDHAEDSPYVGLGIGDLISSSNSGDRFTFTAYVGKRFRIADHVAWSPQIAFTSFGSSDDDSDSVTDWTFSAFRFSVLL